METELSFLLTLLLEHKLPKATQGAIKERLKKLQEAPLLLPPIQRPAAQISIPPEALAQAPSTARLMAQHGLEMGAGAVTTPAQVVRVPPADIDKETGRPRIATGNGTSGPRKW